MIKNFIFIILLSSLFKENCTNKSSNDLSQRGDYVISYNITCTEKSYLKDWNIPQKEKITLLLNDLVEVKGNKWNECYADWDCKITGRLMYENINYFYTLDTSGWIILSNAYHQRYFVCIDKNKCWQYFHPEAESLCDEEMNSKM